MAGSATGLYSARCLLLETFCSSDGLGASAVPAGPKKGANSSIILTTDDSRIGQLTNLSLINDNNTLVWLFSASGGCHQIHFKPA